MSQLTTRSRVRDQFLRDIARRFGRVHRLKPSQSLLEIAGSDVRLYLRYSRLHERGATFYGLRQQDLHELEGYQSFICLLWDAQREPLLLPFAEYEDIFHSIAPGEDGQYKAHLYVRDTGTDFAINRVGRFNVDAHFGWNALEDAVRERATQPQPSLEHFQVQALLAAIGLTKNYDIWIPQSDRERVRVSRAPYARLPLTNEQLRSALEPVDVIWLARGSNNLEALFEVEHSTSIYSGLLRFNDIYLMLHRQKTVRFTIVSDERRRLAYARQLNRPTFQASSLSETCTFLDYANVSQWHRRVCGEERAETEVTQ